MKNKIKISIITVVYNGDLYLENTINSVINQTYDNIEYIIIDGGSTDDTIAIIKKHEDKIDYWLSEKDDGIYDAMNKGIELANGEYINFMNAGDMYFDLNVIENLSKYFISDLVYGNHAKYFDNQKDFNIINVKDNKGDRNIPYCHQSLFLKTDIIRNNKFDLKYKIAADYNQYINLKHSYNTIQYVPLTVSLYLEGGLSSIQRENLINEYYMITKKHTPFKSFIIYVIRKIKFKLIGK